MKATELQGKEMPSVLTTCVRDSVSSIFGTIIGVTPEFDGDEEDRNVGDGVVGIISFVGDVSWLLMLALPRQSACNIASSFCGFEIEYDSPDMGDVVGELANVLAGDIVARLAQDDLKVAMSLPTIMRGKDVEPLLPRGLPHKKMHYSMEQGEFMIKMAVAGQEDTLGRKPGT